MPRELKPCGTDAAYSRHLKRGEDPCDPCKEAHREGNRAYPSKKAYARALHKLRHLHPLDFQRLLTDELAADAVEVPHDR
jgi:hypothetical protein